MKHEEKLIQRYEKLKADRGVWDSHWREIAELVYPRRDDFDTKRAAGEKRMTKVFNSTAIQSNELLASGMLSMNVNPATTWFRAKTEGLAEDAARWLDNASKVMLDEINSADSSFYTAAYEYFMEFGAFGTACIFIEEPESLNGVRFQTRPLSEVVIAEGANGQIDTVFRRFEYSVAQIMERWPDNTSEEVQKKFAKGELDSKLHIIHCITPRNKRDAAKRDSKNKPFESTYILQSERIKLEESGFDEFPMPVGRFYKNPMETYGRSPAMTGLPDIKMLNKIMEITIRAGEKAVDPALIVPSDGFLAPLRTVPSGVNVFDSSTGATAGQIIGQMPSSNPSIGLDFVQYLEDKVRSVFFVDQLQLVGGAQMTATEVLQRTEEKIRLMAPVLGRVQNEFLMPVLDRVFGILFRQGKFGTPPESLPPSFEFDFTGQVAMSQKQTEAQGFLRGVEVMTPLLQVNPNLMTDNINQDKLFRDTMDMFGVRMDKLSDEEERDTIRQQQAQIQELQQQLAAAQEVATLNKTIQETPQAEGGL